MSNNVYIISGQYYDFDRKEVTIGGIQTYVTELSEVFREEGMEVFIYSFDSNMRRDTFNGCTIVGYPFNEVGPKRNDAIAQMVKNDMVSEDDLVLVDTDTRISLKVKFMHLLAIQHGINWDIPRYRNHSIIRMMSAKSVSAYRLVNRLKMCSEVVCVDYNFLNWYRALMEQPQTKLIVIPNFTHIPSKIEKPKDKVNIIFARRLVDYRGTRVFVEAIKPILKKFSYITVTVAGNGPDETWMKEQLFSYKNVSFIYYSQEQSAMIHADKHIAVVPTVGSEGTSLSLLEAMASQCAVVCTDVGGMTNIVLDGYNGRMVSAGNVENLRDAICSLIENEEERIWLAENGCETVKQAFSYAKWRERWIKVLKTIRIN